MEESNYKHNYEYLSIEEAKSIIGGTFVQGTTSIGGELATKADIDRLLTAADKKLTSIVPVTDRSSEFICFFECISNETFPDDLQHRWIEVSPIQFTFPADGGSVKITGSYGLTGTLGTRKKVGDIADTITADANATPSSKSGSKTYYYNNDQSQTPTAEVSWTQPNKAEEFPDDEAHRWIRVQPESSDISVDGGTINVTGSYGLTGTYGTEKKVGDITDTIVIESNLTQDKKSGSKTYYYNNNQTDTPTAKITWTQPGRDEEFPDDEAHRWIEITPTNAGNFTEAGGTITVTGSYGLTGSYGTKKTVGQINDIITVERNTTTQTKSGSKTYYYNNASGTAPSATVTWTQDAHIESFTYEYHIYIGPNSDKIQQKFMQFIWQSDQYNQSSKKSVFVNAYKNKINEHNQIVSTDTVEYGIKDTDLTNQFTITDNKAGLIYCYPPKENSSYSDQNLGNFIVYVKESEDVTCRVNLIQDRKGIQIINGDAIMFTYNWNEGTDLDQATFVNLNLPASTYDNYAGYYGSIIDEYKDILYFAGDNMNKGNEYAFIDFKNISKYLNEHRDDQSSIAGKTILQSLTDDNGIIKTQCDLYTNWYYKKQTENITLSYSVYNKDSESATVTTSDKQFVLTGYTKIKDSSQQALCYANGRRNVQYEANVKDGYTLSAKFTYYLDSGVFAFETNKGNVSKWHKGADLSEVECSPSYSNVLFTNDGNNINFSINIDSINQPNYFDRNGKVKIKAYIQQKDSTYSYLLIDTYTTKINQLPYKIESSTPLSDVVKEMDFSESNSVEIIPRVSLDCYTISYSEEKYMEINPIRIEQTTLTIQKQSA